MISFIKNYFEKRRVRGVFERAVSPEVMNELLEDNYDFSKLDQRPVGVVMLLVGGSTPANASQNIAMVTELAHAHGAEYDAITGGLMVYCFGKHPTETADSVRRLAFVEAVRAKLGNEVRIVHGAGTGQVGLFGCESHVLTYTFLMPKFDAALGILVNLPNGDVKEVPFG